MEARAGLSVDQACQLTPRRDADTLVEAIVKPTLQFFSGPGDAAMIDKLTAAAGKHVPRTFLGMQANTT